VHDAIATAARELFEQKGYKSTTTREIAERAGVSEVLIFRHFESKSGLFRQTIVQPLATQLRQLAESFDPGRPSREFFTGLFATLRSERQKILALLSATSYQEDVGADDARSQLIQPVFGSLATVTARDVEHYGFGNVDVRLTTAVAMGTLLGLVTFDEWLFEEPLDASELAALQRETLLHLAHGLAHRPARREEPRPAGR
jgi:AcrR family transcriptional regulator